MVKKIKKVLSQSFLNNVRGVVMLNFSVIAHFKGTTYSAACLGDVVLTGVSLLPYSNMHEWSNVRRCVEISIK